MKISSVVLLLAVPAIAQAQGPTGMSEADMQKLMDMQTCMAKIDQQQLLSIEERQMQFEAEVRPLCQGGKRDAAQEKAIAFEKEMAKHPAIVALGKCGELAKGVVTDMPFTGQEEGDPNEHVCDSLE